MFFPLSGGDIYFRGSGIHCVTITYLLTKSFVIFVYHGEFVVYRRHRAAGGAARGVALARWVDVPLPRRVAMPVAHDDDAHLRGGPRLDSRVSVIVFLDYPFVGDELAEPVVDVVALIARLVDALRHVA